MIDAEEEELSFAPGLTPNSRLSCQSVPDGDVGSSRTNPELEPQRRS